MREKRVMQIKRGLMKRAKKLRLGAKRTGAYVYGTLRRIVGNPRKELTLWGYNPKPSYGHLTGPIRLAEYRSQKQQDEYNKEGWITGVYAKGDEPVGLKLKVEEMRRGLRGNPDHRTRIALQTVRRPMEGYFLGGPDLEESVRFLLRKGYTMAQLKKINPDVEDELSGKKSILPNSRKGLRGNPGKRYTLDADMRKHYSFAQAKRLADERVRRFGMRGMARGVSISRYQKPKMIRVRGFLVERGGDFHKRLLGMKKKDRQIVAQYERGLVGNPAIPANMNNPDYVRAYRRAQLISKLHNKRYSIYAFQLNGKWAFRVGSHRLSSQEQAVDVFDPKTLRENPMRSSFDKPTFGPFNTETRRVDTTTMAGMKEAERLQRGGWYQGPVTLFSSTYYRKRALPKSSIARQIRGNPPMYAHRMMSHRTHGLSLKQMMKLYRLVSSGNPKAVMFARRTLGIPMSESLSQVKAVVYHHVMDLKGKI